MKKKYICFIFKLYAVKTYSNINENIDETLYLNTIFSKKKLSLFLLYLFLGLNIIQIIDADYSLSSKLILNRVDHKNSDLNTYLDLIKFNTHEKNEILSYILKNKNGIYLEVGTGGDPIADLLSHIPYNMPVTIIACDIDSAILEALPKRHPDLLKYMDNTTNKKLKLVLQQVDGTNMHCFKNDYLSGINASAVVHEIVSYAGGFEGFNNFFSESFRVLKENGVLIYRDPEGVTNKNQLVKLTLTNKSIKLFSHIFIPKFLDRRYSKLAKFSHKSEKYNIHDITVSCYLKNCDIFLDLPYDEYLKIPSNEIDFFRKYTILLPRGLCREIERHYLTYLHQCNPLIFVNCIPNLDLSFYSVNFFAQSTYLKFENFIKMNNLNFSDNLLDLSAKNVLEKTIASNIKTIEYGLPIRFSLNIKLELLQRMIQEYGFDDNLYLTHVKNNDYLLDYRIYGLFYDDIIEEIFDNNNGPINKEDTIHAQWLKREGEESYIYYSDDELIMQVAKISLSHNKNGEKFILCPISSQHNFFIPRLCYEEVLRSSLNIKDSFGYEVDIKEGKRIIHFMKMKIEDAYLIFLDIIKTNPDYYKNLNKFVNEEFIIKSNK